MKNFFYTLFVALIVITSCQPKTKTVPFDSVTAKEDLTKTLDKMYLAYNTKDIKALVPLLADDGLYYGTDPEEIWDKTTYVKLMTKMFADTSYSPKLTVEKREIRFKNNGNSAIVVDQFIPSFMKQIPVRQIYHLTKVDDNWICDFSSMALIPKNADLAKITSALN